MVENTWVPGGINPAYRCHLLCDFGDFGVPNSSSFRNGNYESSLPPYHRVDFCSVVITVSTQTMHYYKGNPSK